MQKVLIFAIIIGLYATIAEPAVRPMYDSLHITEGKCYYKLVTMNDGEERDFNPECERWTCSANTFELFVDGCPPLLGPGDRYVGHRDFWPDCCNDTFIDIYSQGEYSEIHYGDESDYFQPPSSEEENS